MSRSTTTTKSQPESTHRTERLSRDVVLDVLNNQRRRYVVHYLKHHDDNAVRLGDLAERVASWELDKPVAELDYQERKRVKNALQQFHLPKMEEMRFVEFDEREGVVGLSNEAAEQDFYVDVLPKRGIPWGVYYLGLSGIGVVIVLGLLLSVLPFTLLAPITWSAFFATALLVSSVGHFYDNYYRMRLGAREKPPEVETA